MGFFSSSFLAFSMSTDAFAVSLSRGTAMRKHKITEAMRIGALFGSVEASAPLLGWGAGLFAYGFAREIDHWVAFSILCGIGLKFIYESFTPKEERQASETAQNIPLLFLTAMATSVDSFAVGISLAFIDCNILVAALSIGMATFLMVTTGIMTGRYIGEKAGRYAERLGGAGLILIGTKILLEHMGVF